MAHIYVWLLPTTRIEDSNKLDTTKGIVDLAMEIATEDMEMHEAVVLEVEAVKQIADIKEKLKKKVELIAKKKSWHIKTAKKFLVSNDQSYIYYST